MNNTPYPTMTIDAVKQTIFLALNGVITSGKFVYVEGQYYYDNNFIPLPLDKEANAYLLEMLEKRDLDLGDL